MDDPPAYSLCTLCMSGVHGGLSQGIRSLETGLTEGCEPPTA